MRHATFFIFIVFCQAPKAQDKKTPTLKDYFSLQTGIAIPTGQFSDDYQLGFSTTGLLHIPGVAKGAEIQLQAGFQQFSPVGNNSFGNITALPFKIGWQQNVDKDFYIYGRIGMLTVKDAVSTYQGRFSLDFGVVFDLKKVGLDIGFNGWKKEDNAGWSNYLTFGLIFPFHKNE